MKGKLFLDQNLIWVMILLGHLQGNKSCTDTERNALFELKKDLVGTSDYVFATWTNGTKRSCCQWKGVECNHTSGRVIKLSIRTLNLKDSSLLNLSLLHPFEELRNLDLSTNGFNGLFDDVEGYKSLGRLRNLEILDLSLNEFTNSIFPFLNAATSLTTLFLRDNYMFGSFPAKALRDLTNLELLDLRRNRFNGSIPVQDLSAMWKLKALALSDNQFSGSLKFQEICELKNMQELDLSRNQLVGQFPVCLTSLTELRVLDLSSNQLSGKIPSSLGNLNSLEYLSLFDNNFEGSFSFNLLTNFSKLKVLQLCSTSNSLQVESESSWKPKFQLRSIALRSCNLKKVPHFLLQQKDLSHVDLSDNNISGNFPSWLLGNNTNLKVLILHNNSFSSFQLPEYAHNLHFLDVSVNEFSNLFPENMGWILPHLQCLNISQNSFYGNLPSSLGNMKRIEYLDISHNNFHGKLPRSIAQGCYSMIFMKLSYNKLSGEVFPESVNFTRIMVLSMDNNMFTGMIGQGLRSLDFLFRLDISNNSLTGVIPSWFDELLSLSQLLVSNNMLEGVIPVSVFNISNLQLLDLSANNLSGDIPPHINSISAVYLFLQDNKLSGAIPKTLLRNVRILDLRNNRLSGDIPEFINTQNISILLLRGNKLTGRLPRRLCTLRNIHLLDLANNRLNGSIPSCLSNISFGSGKADELYSYDFSFIYSPTDFQASSDLEQDSTLAENVGSFFKSLLVLDLSTMNYMAGTQTKVEFSTKHRYDAYMGGNLKHMSGIDLSENELSGEIPKELGGLLELYALNLSHNKLSGVIPKSFSGMKNVESLDLSFNRFQGRIPPELTELTSLAVFNVSFNHLSGVIPEGRQFNTFDIQSYLGNPFLCGRPINISCNSNNFQETDNGVEVDESITDIGDMESFYWSFGAAYVTVLVGIFASLSFDSPWKRFWFHIVDAFIHKATNFW